MFLLLPKNTHHSPKNKNAPNYILYFCIEINYYMMEIPISFTLSSKTILQMKFPRKTILLIAIISSVLLVFDAIFLKNRFADYTSFMFFHKGMSKVLIYWAGVSISLVALSLLLFVKKRSLFILAMAMIAIFYTIDGTYLLVNGDGFSYSDLKVALMWGDTDIFVVDTIETFYPMILRSMALTSILMVVLLGLRKIITSHQIFIKPSLITLTLLSSYLVTYLIQYKTANSTDVFPATHKLINTSLYGSIFKIYTGKREVLMEKPEKKQHYKNIIWIIDESVGGQYLSLNGYPEKTTPYLDSLQGSMLNLGLASSCTNCSSITNISLMSGIKAEDLPDKNYKSLKKPSIFQYAKNAGYATSYITGQFNKGDLLNYMTKHDLKYIDHYYQPNKYIHGPDEKYPEDDVVENIRQNLQQNESNFMFVVKRGAHFPYEENYPQTHKVFTPTLSKNEWHNGTKKLETTNSYLNSLRWRVNDFFAYFFKETNILDRDDTLIIYTADHGQSILEDGQASTHCDARNPSKAQGIVPFILFAKNTNAIGIPASQKNKASHFLMFPSTLKMMGYRVTDKTLFDAVPDNAQVFFHGDLFGNTALNYTSIQ